MSEPDVVVRQVSRNLGDVVGMAWDDTPCPVDAILHRAAHTRPAQGGRLPASTSTLVVDPENRLA